MKKIFVLSVAGLLLHGLYAQPESKQAEEKTTRTTRVTKDIDIKKELENANVVRYSITIYHNDTEYDKDAWRKTLDQTVKLVGLGSQEDKNAEFIEELVSSIQRIYKRSNTNDGIHGEIKIGFGDGVCACGSGCDCAEKYKNICPCNAIEGSDCRSEKVQCPGHK